MSFNSQLQIGNLTTDSSNANLGRSPLLSPPYSFPKSKPGTLQLLWSANYPALYHRLSPYTDYDRSLASKIFSDTEPFVYTYIDQNNPPNSLIPYESTMFPMGSAPQDILRVTKFMASGRGLAFLATQALLQTGNAFNETRIYNPTSPIVAAGIALTGGATRPTRFLDISGGVSGIAGSLFGSAGSTVATAIFGASPQNPPPGTLPSGLTTFNLNNSKGLLRAQTANTGKSLLEMKWPVSSNSGNSHGGLSSMITNLAKGLFANFIPATQKGIIIRSDEGTYGRMVKAGSQPWGNGIRFGYVGDTRTLDFMQRWIAGGKTMRKNGEYPSNPGLIINSLNNSAKIVVGMSVTKAFSNIAGNATVTIVESTNQLKPGFRYGDAHFGSPANQDVVMGSDMLVGWQDYENNSNQFPSKKTDATSAEVINDTLKAVIAAIKNEGIYTVNIPDDSTIVRPGTYGVNGYDRLMATVNKNPAGTKPLPGNYPLGVLSQYRKSFVEGVDSSIDGRADGSYKLPTNGRFDAINTLTVLKQDKQISNSPFKGWTTWAPYNDDLIAFYFYDIVNSKFVPFRCTVKGLSENGNASWDELTFINRADRVYSYAGFTRNLNVTFHIAIGSIVELAPTYQRLNYLVSLIKPANYTFAAGSEDMNRFMVPPMVMLTVGDLYKDQPILIQSITTTVPDDASWETSTEFNSQEWTYLANYIKSPGVLYGQLPRSIDISLGLILLEKERAIVGGANFSHAPRMTDKNQNWVEWNTDTPLGANPKKLGKSLVVVNT